MKSPNQQVSESIAKAMVEAKLLNSAAESELANKIASGSQTAADWKALFMEQIMNEAQTAVKPEGQHEPNKTA